MAERESPPSARDTLALDGARRSSGGGDARMPDTPYEVIVDALENAGFKGTWRYHPDLEALTAAMDTAEIVVAALTEAGFLSLEADDA